MSKGGIKQQKHPKTKPRKIVGSPKNQPLSKAKKTFFAITFVGLVLMVVILTEVFMRIAGYGIDTRVFIKPKYKPDIYVGNANFEHKYYSYSIENIKFPDMVINNVFPVVKSKGTLRGFVLGGSSAQGFPYESNHSFSKILELALTASKKYQKVEILNLGRSAMSSYYEKDTAMKLLSYRPDFLVLYSGHNEYYGRISASTGGNYFSKNLYLYLKELKIFQMLFNLTAQPPNKNDTLMAEQFNHHQFIKNDGFDKQVAEDFIKNVDSIVKAYALKNIPVIVIEPVSNLMDMPPFAGEKDEQYRDFIKQYQEIITKADRVKLQEFYERRLSHQEYDLNANIRYLDATARSVLDGKPSLTGYTIAKDLDTIPFRARSSLGKALRTYCRNKSGIYKNLHFIPLPDVLQKQYGETVLSNRIFIDQLHFNMYGQVVMSKVISAKIAEIFKFTNPESEKVAAFYLNGPEIVKRIHFLPAFQINVIKTISHLLANEPFIGMRLKYNQANNFTPAAYPDAELAALMETSSFDVIPSELIIDYYIYTKRNEMARNYVAAGIWAYPGSCAPYLIAARYYRQMGQIALAKDSYINAYLLSEKNQDIYNEMNDYFRSNGLSDVIQGLDRKYGNAVKY
jgi:lysophospholipase L1-like esterase